MERLFQILAVILIGIAAYFLWIGNYDALFVAAVFGAVCFFLSIRFQVGERLKEREIEREEEEKRREGEEEIGDLEMSRLEESANEEINSAQQTTNNAQHTADNK